MPDDIFEHFHLTGESGAYWEDSCGFFEFKDESDEQAERLRCPCCKCYEEDEDSRIEGVGNYEEFKPGDIPF